VYRVQIVIVGAEPAGLSAACAAVESGMRIGIVKSAPEPGGQIWRSEQMRPSSARTRKWLNRFRRSSAFLIDCASAFAIPYAGVLLAEDQAGLCEIHWKRLILGHWRARTMLPFPGRVLPGVFGAGGLQAIVKRK
jgi:hypothetical protein